MKRITGIVVGLVLLATINASAWTLFPKPKPFPTESMSWEQIRADKRVTIAQTAMANAFGSDDIYGGPGFFNACVDGQVLRSVVPSQVCTQWKNVGGGQEDGGAQTVCTKFEAKHVALDINQTQQVCKKWKTIGGGQENGGGDTVCTEYSTVNFSLPTSPVFTVYHVQAGNGGGQEGDGSGAITHVLFKKAYHIPACY
jgi:hypothetical protein